MIPKLIAKFTNSLALGVETSSTEMLLSSTVSRDNQTIPSGTYGFVINRGQENEEFCIGSYVAGTVTFTARGLSYLDGITEISANKKKHRKGDPVEMTTHPALTYIAKMLAGDVDLDGILKYPATRLINNQRQLVDKEYADSIVSSQITSLKVSADGALTVAVNSGYYSLNGVITYYAGSAGNALTDDAVNYIQMNDGVLNINTSGFTEGAMPLAKITTASGAITINEDARAILGWLDIKTNSGIGRDSTGLFVDLATAPGLEFSSGKLRAKVDPSGGLKRTAAGLGANVGLSEGNLVQLVTGGKLPAVDGSQLTGLPNSIYQQFLPTITKSYNGDAYGRVYFATVDSEYSLYVIGGEGNSNRYFTLYRFVLDSATKQYKLSWSKNVDGGGGGQPGLYGCTVLGDYVYFVGHGANIRRVDKATGTNEVTMTVSGANVYTYQKGLVNDGTYIYMLRGEGGGYPIQKFSVSGTTLTFISQNYTNTSNLHYISFVKDGFAYNFFSGTYKKINLATGAVSNWTPGTAGVTCNTGTMTFYSTRFSGDIMLTVSLNGTGSDAAYLPASSVVSFSTVTAF